MKRPNVIKISEEEYIERFNRKYAPKKTLVKARFDQFDIIDERGQVLEEYQSLDDVEEKYQLLNHAHGEEMHSGRVII